MVSLTKKENWARGEVSALLSNGILFHLLHLPTCHCTHSDVSGLRFGGPNLKLASTLRDLSSDPAPLSALAWSLAGSYLPVLTYKNGLTVSPGTGRV